MGLKLATESASISVIQNTLLYHSVGLCTSATLLCFTSSPRNDEIFRQNKPTTGLQRPYRFINVANKHGDFGLNDFRLWRLKLFPLLVHVTQAYRHRIIVVRIDRIDGHSIPVPDDGGREPSKFWRFIFCGQ
jgi:hypothetical protein